jgi:ribonuclease J
MAQYKYVFVLAASTNLDRICGLSKATPWGRYFLCDQYQWDLLELVQQDWGHYSALYRDIKKTVYKEKFLSRYQERGFVMMVRDNRHFRQIIPKFDPAQSIMLYSMWDGYRTRTGSTIPDFLALTGTWESLHTSGHATPEDIALVVQKADPEAVLPMHTQRPDALQALCPGRKVVLLQDGEAWSLP